MLRRQDEYTEASVRECVTRDLERLFAPWAVGRPAGWICDERTRHLVATGFWLTEELTRLGVSEDDRKRQERSFNRKSRAEDDLFALAARLLNDARTGNFDQYAGRG